MFNELIAIAIGIVTGIIGGGLGLAGTAIMMPLLLLTNIVPDYQTMIGTLLFFALPPISLLAVIEYGKRKQIDYIIGTLLFFAYFFGAYYGSIINQKYTDKTLIYASSFILLIVSVSLFFIGYYHKNIPSKI